MGIFDVFEKMDSVGLFEKMDVLGLFTKDKDKDKNENNELRVACGKPYGITVSDTGYVFHCDAEGHEILETDRDLLEMSFELCVIDEEEYNRELKKLMDKELMGDDDYDEEYEDDYDDDYDDEYDDDGDDEYDDDHEDDDDARRDD